MRFGWSEDQLAFRDAARDLLSKECGPDVVRTAWEGAPDPKPWSSLEAMGVLSVLVPEADGGLGLDETFLVPVLEEAGRAALPQPITDTAMVAASLGVTGSVVVTDLGGPIVGSADTADGFLLAVDGGVALFDADQVEREPVTTVDRSRHAARIRATGPGRTVTDDASEVAAARDRGALGTAAELVGLADQMLAITVDYVGERQQFGKPIGSFQAVKHHLANARVAIEFAGPAVARAAWSIAEGADTASRDASMAKYLANEAAAESAKVALQCHGAIGYTVECDLHLYLKRSWALRRLWGDSDHHVDRVAGVLFE